MAFDDERFWDRESAPKLSPIGKFVEAKSLGLDASSAGILHRNRSQRSTIVSIAVFLGTLPYLSMKRSHNFIEYAFTTPVFIVPKHLVRWQVCGQVSPIAAILQLIEHSTLEFGALSIWLSGESFFFGSKGSMISHSLSLKLLE